MAGAHARRAGVALGVVAATVLAISWPVTGAEAGASVPDVDVVTVDELPDTPHGSDTSQLTIVGMNDRGRVVGNGHRGFTWTLADGFVDLGRGRVSAVGNDGHVLRWDAVSGQPEQPYVWDALGGKVHPGPAPDGGTFVPTAINDHGVVVGTTTSPGLHGYLWSPTDGYVATTVDGGVAVNDDGEVISRTHFWSEATGTVALGNLGGHSHETFARAINNAGQVVGWSFASGDVSHAFSWTLAGGMVDLGLLPGFEFSDATAVNDDGLVVGTAREEGSSRSRAFRWTEAGGLQGLAGGSVESSATAVNGAGLVVGFIDGRLSAWTPGGVSVPLDPSELSQPGTAVDDSGEVAGTVRIGDDAYRLTIWRVGFVDDTTTPETTARIVDTGGLEVHVRDAASPGDGVQVVVGSGSGHATLTACGGFVVEVDADSAAVITCGSVRIEVTAGTATVPLAGGFSRVSVPAGVGAEVSDLGAGEFEVANLGGGTVQLTVDGVARDLPADATDSVALPRPDLLLRAATDPSFVGDDVYNRTASGQKRSRSARRLATIAFPIRLQNDGPDVDRYVVRGWPGNADVGVRYMAGGQDVTAAVVAGTFQTPQLAADQFTGLTAKITVRGGAPFGRRRTVAVTATSVTAPAQVDKVKATVIVVR